MFSQLLLKLPAPRMADWRFSVSLAMMSLCESGECLVICTDAMATLGAISADRIAKKDAPLHKDWTASYVGDDMGHAPPIIGRAQTILGRAGERTADQVANALAQAYDERLQRQIERKILKKHRFTAESFRDQGKRKMTEVAYNRIVDRIEKTSLKCEFLVGGFESASKAKLFSVDGESEPMSYDDLGFWAIGSGAAVAIGALGFFAEKSLFGLHNSPEEAIYFLLQAKFTAETVRTVGRESLIIVRRFNDSNLRYLSPIGFNLVRTAWEKRGAPRVPMGISKEISKYIWDASDFTDIPKLTELFLTKGQRRRLKAKQSDSQTSESKQ